MIEDYNRSSSSESQRSLSREFLRTHKETKKRIASRKAEILCPLNDMLPLWDKLLPREECQPTDGAKLSTSSSSSQSWMMMLPLLLLADLNIILTVHQQINPSLHLPKQSILLYVHLSLQLLLSLPHDTGTVPPAWAETVVSVECASVKVRPPPVSLQPSAHPWNSHRPPSPPWSTHSPSNTPYHPPSRRSPHQVDPNSMYGLSKKWGDFWRC